MNWVKDNEETLRTYAQSSSSEATSSPLLMSLHDEAVPIANIQSQPAMQSFHVEAKMLLLDDEQRFYELMCSKCKQFVRTSIIKAVDCVNCDQHAMLPPRCRFQVEIADRSGSAIATIFGESGENLLSMKAEQIYEITKIKNEVMPLQQRLANKVFKVQLKKLLSRASDETPAKLFILSYVEKQDAPQLPAPSTFTTAGESSKRELGNLSSPQEQKELITEPTSSSKRQQIERTTPTRKNASSSRKQNIEPVTAAKKK
uniref:Uncharacterized protein LOC104213421 n=2 Tax=Nicotiana sylvestris TaxID=4096 RepID=A0A1U7V8E8_NICSY|nr:PREDICTED: uncharacterized protein LOC104213421 [Nicotiana sylvestris]